MRVSADVRCAAGSPREIQTTPESESFTSPANAQDRGPSLIKFCVPTISWQFGTRQSGCARESGTWHLQARTHARTAMASWYGVSARRCEVFPSLGVGWNSNSGALTVRDCLPPPPRPPPRAKVDETG